VCSSDLSSASATACLSIGIRLLRQLPEHQRAEPQQRVGGAHAKQLLQLSARQEVVELAIRQRVGSEMTGRGQRGSGIEHAESAALRAYAERCHDDELRRLTGRANPEEAVQRLCGCALLDA